ncbi:glycoside hydrolase family 2 protein [Paenibacillus sp. GXUN7292]|uniref:glycoside hydrolase family 2 protein n=1 Tax=Paenibacillus sp. GXUN7292 TaxID=3422499 RepID=UPI003D7E4CA6
MRLLKLVDWKLKGFYPYVPFLGNSLETQQELMGITDWLPAEVPGCVQHDLWKVGWIDDPYKDMNSLKCEWVENRWWMYRTCFSITAGPDESILLIFKGIDYKAHIYMNGHLLAAHEGMFEPVELSVDAGICQTVNELIVLFEHVPDEMGQIGYTSKTHTQKSRFNYKWDFSTRMVPIGLWDDVYIKVVKSVYWGEVRLTTSFDEQTGIINWHGTLKIAASASDLHFDKIAAFADVVHNGVSLGKWRGTLAESGSFNFHMAIPDILLWYPNGLGEQPLYHIKVSLYYDGELCDEWTGRTGFRSLKWIPNDASPEDALPYTLLINSSRMYIKGMNLTPLDMLYGTVTKERYEDIVLKLKKANINLVRVWGGGLIEKDIFYELCDEHGILIWQEFIQSSSGIDNIPSQQSEFIQLLERAAYSALICKRNHISLACWSGGNELRDEHGIPSTAKDNNIAMLKAMVHQLDPDRHFFPTSASGPNEFLSLDHLGKNYDVHGPWKYAGPVEQYRLYNYSDSLLHSEFGVDGLTSYASMQRFMNQSELKVQSMQENDIWRHHGEWWCTKDREDEMFGNINDLREFVIASQWTQAEGLRYGLEANRRRKYSNSGSIVWQFNEPFPNVSCTSVIDYYHQPKMAYYWVRKAFANQHLSLKYDQLIINSEAFFFPELYFHNSLEEGELNWKIECIGLQGESIHIQQGCHLVSSNTSTKIEELNWNASTFPMGIIVVRLSGSFIGKSYKVNDFYKNNSSKDKLYNLETNTYLFSTKPNHYFSDWLRAPSVELVWSHLKDSSSEEIEVFEVINMNRVPALYVVAAYMENGIEKIVISKQNYSVLFADEKIQFEVERRSFGSDAVDRSSIYFKTLHSLHCTLLGGELEIANKQAGEMV